MRLLKLPAPLQSYLREGRLSVGHAKVILGLIAEKDQKTAGERILKEGLNVRQTEELVARLQARHTGAPVMAKPNGLHKDTHVADLENRLRERLGTKVNLKYAHGKGALEISFFSDAEFERILDILGLQE